MFKTIEKYYLSDLVNPNNKTDLKATELKEKIEKTREYIKEYFNWEGNIVFLPNPYYAKKTLLSFLVDIPNLRVFSNSIERDGYLFEEANLNVSSLKSIGGLLGEDGSEMCIWFSCSESALIKENIWVKNSNPLLIVEIENIDSSLPINTSAFILNVIDGVTILGFNSKISLNPLILGSDSVSFANRDTLEIKKDYRNLEVGTCNVPLLLYLNKVFKTKINRDHE